MYTKFQIQIQPGQLKGRHQQRTMSTFSRPTPRSARCARSPGDDSRCSPSSSPLPRSRHFIIPRQAPLLCVMIACFSLLLLNVHLSNLQPARRLNSPSETVWLQGVASTDAYPKHNKQQNALALRGNKESVVIAHELGQQVAALNTAIETLKNEVIWPLKIDFRQEIRKQGVSSLNHTTHDEYEEDEDEKMEVEEEDADDIEKNGDHVTKEQDYNWEVTNPVFRTGQPPVCSLDDNGPIPVILMTLGRSGSSSTWQVMGNLTGYVTSAREYTGKDSAQANIFFESVNKGRSGSNGNWALKYMCAMQHQYPDAGVVGFKWKTFHDSFFSRGSIDALRMLAYSHSPQMKVVRSRRNLLDVLISGHKHRVGHVDAHCAKDDEECIKLHLSLGTGLVLPTKRLLAEIRRKTKEEDDVDCLLEELGVPHIKVSFEKLYYSDDAEEWMRIFRFLGVGPTEGLTRKHVHEATKHAATHSPHHNVTLENYEEVRRLLVGTEVEGLLH